MKRMLLVAALLIAACRSSDRVAPAVPSGQRLRVRVVKVETKTLGGTRTFPGVLQPWERATLGARVAGNLIAFRVDRGSRVKRGELLATIGIPGLRESLAQAEAQLHTAEAELQLAKDQAERAKQVASSNSEAIAGAEVAALTGKETAAGAHLQAARAELARARSLETDARLDAPFDGVVTARFADPGAILTVGAKVVEVVALDPLRLAIDVPEREASLVRVGQAATIVLPTAGDRKLAAKVARFAEVLDPATHTLRVEIDVPNGDRRIVAGIEAHATIDFGAHAALVLPIEALASDANGSFVFVLDGDHVRKRPVTVVYDDGKQVEVREVRAREEALLGGRAILKDGDAVEVAR